MPNRGTGRYITVEFECKHCHHFNRQRIDLAELGFEERYSQIPHGMSRKVARPCERCGKTTMVTIAPSSC